MTPLFKGEKINQICHILVIHINVFESFFMFIYIQLNAALFSYLYIF
jgi:hypothetical protein